MNSSARRRASAHTMLYFARRRLARSLGNACSGMTTSTCLARTANAHMLNAGSMKRKPRLCVGLIDWRSLLVGDVAQARTAFRQLLTSPIVFTPFKERGRRGIRFEGRVGTAAILGRDVVTKVASQSIPSWNQISAFLESMRRLRESGAFAA